MCSTRAVGENDDKFSCESPIQAEFLPLAYQMNLSLAINNHLYLFKTWLLLGTRSFAQIAKPNP